MNKNKFYTIGLLAGSLFTTSCDDIVDCGCDCNQPEFTSIEMLKDGEKPNKDGSVTSGSAVVIRGKNLTDITEISFLGINAEIQPSFFEDNKIIFQIPEGISEDCVAKVRTTSCDKGYTVKLLKVAVAPACAAMCDNEMAVKTITIVGNSFFAPLTAKFWDGNDNTIVASTEDGSIDLIDSKTMKINIPEGVKDGGRIVFETKAGRSESDFIFRDTRNMLITHDDEEYLNKFNQNTPDGSVRIDTVKNADGSFTLEEIGIDINKEEEAKEGGMFYSENRNGNFSVFYDFAGYNAWTYSPEGDANPTGDAPEYPSPFGVFSESIAKGETSFSDYVIKFEVFVPEEYPMNGNGLAVGFFNTDPMSIRSYCAFWQPSQAYFAKDEKGIWKESATFDNWTSHGDWMTVTIPMSELKYDFMAKNYYCSCQSDRENREDAAHKYDAFGDKDGGLAFFDKNAKYASTIMESRKVKPFQSVGIELGAADQPNSDNEPYIAVDNLRITPDDNNGACFPLLMWGQPLREYFIKPVYSCK